MKQIWKFYAMDENTLWGPVKNQFTLHMPEGAEILDLQVQHNAPVIFALVNPLAQLTERKFRPFGTGQDIDDSEGLHYIGSYQVDNGYLVLHLFEDIGPIYRFGR